MRLFRSLENRPVTSRPRGKSRTGKEAVQLHQELDVDIVALGSLAVGVPHVVLVQIDTCRANGVSQVALARAGVEYRAVAACGCSSAVRRGLHVPIVAAAVVGCRGGRPSSLVSQSRFSCTSIFRLERTERVASLGVLARLTPLQRATATPRSTRPSRSSSQPRHGLQGTWCHRHQGLPGPHVCGHCFDPARRISLAYVTRAAPETTHSPTCLRFRRCQVAASERFGDLYFERNSGRAMFMTRLHPQSLTACHRWENILYFWVRSIRCTLFGPLYSSNARFRIPLMQTVLPPLPNADNHCSCTLLSTGCMFPL